MRKPEILAPAGNLEKLKTAIDYGADAVYLGGSKLNLRAFADNFTNEDMQEAVEYAHSRGRKVYVTLNVFPHNSDLDGLEQYIIDLKNAGIDAVIVSDPSIIMTIKEVAEDLEIHLSTQANNVNWKSALFWHNLGVKRIVLARELTLKEIKEIRERLPETCDLEAFVHGSMCMAYSGRCLISNYMTGRDANRGACAQACRYKYYLVEEKRPGEYFPVSEDDKGTYIMNSKDLCMIEHIDEVIEAGVYSLKIEGRMKSAFYVASVVKAYREAVDTYMENPENYKYNPKWMEYLFKVSHRSYYTGFYYGHSSMQIYETSAYVRDYDIVGVVKSYDEETNEAVIEQRNRVFEGDEVEVLRVEGDMFTITLDDMKDGKDNKINVAPRAQMIFKIKCPTKLNPKDMLIKSKEAN
ncbi:MULTISPECIES: peptidase U32 family protein [Clostridium]|uniref:Putative protease n=1 Tax=Clostridium cadaveris TaxID=1529 RepID=A0A1I2JGS7_9CLOT|nr:U32 family peptidase [Clostridium cadaveris]MDU4951980.1 U32 family peptidase [Clostridium sp.]MDM8311831.1 U32 family peptidase [Clostridium cadaveris]MDY4950344.1 U32 family peptidase [Clostridium cadaveris]NME65863.1 U32 family peptidase [Clostridium cadaveris]NWK11850.1 U32 family peptidase [Clostridium cadaveris]